MGIIQSSPSTAIMQLDVVNIDTQYESYLLNKDKWVTIRERTGDLIIKIILNQKGPDRQPHRWYSVQVPNYYSIDSKRVADTLFVNLKPVEYDPEMLETVAETKTVHIAHHHNLTAIKLLTST